MGFAGRDFDNHEPLWLKAVRVWDRDDPKRFLRWQELAREHAKEMDRKAAGKKAWEAVAQE